MKLKIKPCEYTGKRTLFIKTVAGQQYIDRGAKILYNIKVKFNELKKLLVDIK